MGRSAVGPGNLLHPPVSWKWQTTHTHETAATWLPKENMNKADREANVEGQKLKGPHSCTENYRPLGTVERESHPSPGMSRYLVILCQVVSPDTVCA